MRPRGEYGKAAVYVCVCTADSRTAIIFMLSDIVVCCSSRGRLKARAEEMQLLRVNQMLFVSAVEPVGI